MKPEVIDYLKVIEDEKDISEHLIPFDEIIAEPVGSAMKGFAMIKGEYIGEVYDIIRDNPNSHYRFCGDDFIRSVSKDEFSKMKYSAIIRKSRRGTDFAISELIGSRICELFGIECPFVAPLGKSNTVVASLDFLKYGQRMETYAEYTGAMFDRKATAEDWARAFSKTMEQDNSYNLTNDKKKLLTKELIKHYIVRRFLLQDNDFNCGNVALVSDKNQNNYILFNYSEAMPLNFMETNIKGLMESFPEEISEVINELQITPERYEAINTIFSRFMDKGVADFWTYTIKRNSEMIEYYKNQYSQVKEML